MRVNKKVKTREGKVEAETCLTYYCCILQSLCPRIMDVAGRNGEHEVSEES
jgi:hypothetical protein